MWSWQATSTGPRCMTLSCWNSPACSMAANWTREKSRNPPWMRWQSTSELLEDAMTTPLHSTLKRALTIEGREYVVTLTDTALKLTFKGKRNGVELSWAQLVNGEAALAVALHASLGAFAAAKPSGAAKPASLPTRKKTRKKGRST